MKKLTAGIFATLLAVVSVGAANAEIASKGYVDQQVGTKADAATVSSLQSTVSGHTSQIGTINDTIGGYGNIVTHDADEFATSAQGAKADTAVQPSAITNVERTTNKTTTLSAESTDAQYPSAKAVYDTIQAETSDIASSGDLSALTTRVGTLETASKTHATKTELTEGLAEKLDTATAATTYATKTELAGKQNTIAGAQLEALNSGITADKVEAYDGYAAQISGKLDTATADGKYAVKSTETVASTASTNAQTALTSIGTLSQLTTDAKGNTVAAINEVAKEAADAATAAAGAKTAADTAQGEVDALEAVVNHETTGLAAAHTAIDALESGKLDKTGTAARATADASGNVITTTYATKAEIADMATDENLALKQDKTDNSLTTTSKTVVGAINEVKTTADDASTAAGAAQDAADAAQADATQALADAATAQEAAEAAQTAADSKLPTTTYNTQVGSVSATNMGTTASTVVTAIKEVAGEASTAQSTATAAQQTANQAQQTANAAIPAPTAACADPDNKCVLVSAGAGNYSWEVIARGSAE